MNADAERYSFLREKLILGKITAITFDTQVFDRNGRTFRGGLIEQLGQLKSSNIQLVLTELVKDEAEKHMLAMHTQRAEKLKDAYKNISTYLSEGLRDSVREELDSMLEPRSIVFHEFNDFFLATDAEIVSYEETSVKDLFSRYFSAEPPFHKLNPKKSEFPDAIALMSLEAYSENSGVLVVSDDSDWISFCSNSKFGNLHCVRDLGVALSLINSVKADIEKIANERFIKFKEFCENGMYTSLIDHNAVQKLKEGLSYFGRTGLICSFRCVEVEILSMISGDDSLLGKIRDDSALTAWVIELDLECRVIVEVSFYSDERELLGSSLYNKAIEVPSTSIVKITGEDITLETLVRSNMALDLGVIAPGENRVVD